MNTSEIEKSIAHDGVNIIEYVTHAVVIKTILKKLTGSIRLMSFDQGEGLVEKTTPFDTYLQIIDGEAEITMEGACQVLETGQFFIIPAHTSNQIKAKKSFKMILVVIKSGYE